MAPSSVHASPGPMRHAPRSDSSAEPAAASTSPAVSHGPGRWRSSGQANSAASSVPAQVRNADVPADVVVSPMAWNR